MNVKIERKEKYISISLVEDKLLSSNSKDFKESILDPAHASYRNFIVDLSNVKYIDSSGLSAVLLAYKSCKAKKGLMVLCGLNDAVKSLIKISQLDTILSIVSTYEEARDLIMMEELEKDING